MSSLFLSFFSANWTWPRCSYIMCQKKACSYWKKICCDWWQSPHVVLCSAPLNRKQNTYLMQYLITLAVTLTVSLVFKKRKKREAYQLLCKYLLDKCKGYLPFHVCILWTQSLFYLLHINFSECEWMVDWILWLSLFMWNVCEWMIWWLVLLKQYERKLWVEMPRNIN